MQNSNSKQEVSREDLKKQLEAIQSFDISSFGESKNQASTNLRGLIHTNQSLFPRVDAPTLQLLEDSEYNIRYLDLDRLETKPREKPKKKQHKNHHDYYEDLTARNSQSATTYQYEDKIQEMEKLLQKMNQKLEGQRKQKQLLHEKINLLEIHHKKVLEQLKDKNKQQKEQIKLLKERQIKAIREKDLLEKQLNKAPQKTQTTYRDSRAGSISSGQSIHSSTVMMTSYMEDPSYFCPQLLSPEETVMLLSKLLKKVSKSSKMIKELTDDQSVKTILNKIQKK